MNGVQLSIIGATFGLLAPLALAQEDEAIEQELVRLAASKAKITLAQAIEAASKDAANLTLVEVGLWMDGEKPVYEISFLTGTGAKDVVVDALSGKVLSSQEAAAEPDEAEEFAATKKALAAAKVTLRQAIERAQKEAKGGTVVDGEADVDEGKLTYDVALLADGKVIEVQVDAAGKVLKVKPGEDVGSAWIFDGDKAGELPRGWKIAYTGRDGKAAWAVATDASAPTPPHVFSLIKTESPDATFNLAIAEKPSLKDVDLSVQIKANSGKVDQGGGLIWRCKDENNYYICRINPLESNFRVYKVVDGKRQQLLSVKVETKAERWYGLRATMAGNQITCYLDDKKLLEATDETFKDAGHIGLWTKADAASSFDNLSARAPVPEAREKGEPHDKSEKADAKTRDEGTGAGKKDDGPRKP